VISMTWMQHIARQGLASSRVDDVLFIGRSAGGESGPAAAMENWPSVEVSKQHASSSRKTIAGQQAQYFRLFRSREPHARSIQPSTFLMIDQRGGCACSTCPSIQ
jgi:hypothetical protein